MQLQFKRELEQYMQSIEAGHPEDSILADHRPLTCNDGGSILVWSGLAWPS